MRAGGKTRLEISDARLAARVLTGRDRAAGHPQTMCRNRERRPERKRCVAAANAARSERNPEMAAGGSFGKHECDCQRGRKLEQPDPLFGIWGNLEIQWSDAHRLSLHEPVKPG